MNLHDVLVSPLVTEKTEMLRETAKEGRYSLKVHPDANKEIIRQALHKIYNVKAVKVNIIVVPGKNKKFRNGVYRTPTWKKAIVTLAPGQKIDFAG